MHPTLTVTVEYEVSANFQFGRVKIEAIKAQIYSDNILGSTAPTMIPVPSQTSNRTEDARFLGWIIEKAREAHQNQKSK